MRDFCECDDWKGLKKDHPELFKWSSPYGWIISWVELTNEKTYTQIHRYGININYCPMCGKELEKCEDEG